jgi:hypothetical protein
MKHLDFLRKDLKDSLYGKIATRANHALSTKSGKTEAKAVPKVLRHFPETRFLFACCGNVPLHKEMITKREQRNLRDNTEECTKY